MKAFFDLLDIGFTAKCFYNPLNNCHAQYCKERNLLLFDLYNKMPNGQIWRIQCHLSSEIIEDIPEVADYKFAKMGWQFERELEKYQIKAISII